MPATAIDYSVLLALLAGGLACATLVLLYRPATAIPRQVAWWLGTAALLLAIAAAGPAMPGPAVDAGEVIVMVDVSPSTRTATYRDETVIRRRVAELLDGRPARVQRFGDDAATTGRTTFTPPPASAILLFSDGQFEPPATAPPVFSVIDPELDSTRDAAITSLDVRPASAGATRRSPFPAVTAPGDTRVAAMDVAVGVRNDGEARKLTLTGSPPAPAERGRYVVVRPAQGGGEIQAQLSPGDAWPENDRLTTVAPPPQGLERWWVTASGAVPPGWQRLAPAELPTNATSYLGAAVVVLENVPAGAIAPPARDALAAAVRELGSGLVILGGDRGFAAGAYEGTDLEAVSPLSSSPPEPAVRWVFLVDASGSMDAGPPGRTRFDAAVAAVTRALPGVPHGDRVSVGGFAADVTWWLPDAASSDAVNVPLPPPGAAPRGATNLASALRAATAPGADGLRRELVVLTDGGADPPPVANELADALRRADARLHVLALGDGPAMPALREAVGATGGRTVDEGDTARWAAGVTQLLRAAKPDHLVRTPTRVAFDGLADPVTASPWNRTWPKRDAAVIARAAGGTPMAARWPVGQGTAAAVAFTPPVGAVEALAAAVARPPRDPRFAVTWETGPIVRVTIDAVAGDEILNDLDLRLELSGRGGPPTTVPLTQVGPGRYEAVFDAPPRPAIATVRTPAAPIDRRSLAARYPAEFDRVGNDRAALRRLADRTGGRVIEPADRDPIPLPDARRPIDLTPWLATAAAACAAIGLVVWRRAA